MPVNFQFCRALPPGPWASWPRRLSFGISPALAFAVTCHRSFTYRVGFRLAPFSSFAAASRRCRSRQGATSANTKRGRRMRIAWRETRGGVKDGLPRGGQITGTRARGRATSAIIPAPSTKPARNEHRALDGTGLFRLPGRCPRELSARQGQYQYQCRQIAEAHAVAGPVGGSGETRASRVAENHQERG